MIGKITEYPDNLYVKWNGETVLAVDHAEQKEFAKIMMINTLVAYERSQLPQYLTAPFHTNSVTEWTQHKEMLEYLEKLLQQNDQLNFFSEPTFYETVNEKYVEKQDPAGGHFPSPSAVLNQIFKDGGDDKTLFQKLAKLHMRPHE